MGLLLLLLLLLLYRYLTGDKLRLRLRLRPRRLRCAMRRVSASFSCLSFSCSRLFPASETISFLICLLNCLFIIRLSRSWGVSGVAAAVAALGLAGDPLGVAVEAEAGILLSFAIAELEGRGSLSRTD